MSFEEENKNKRKFESEEEEDNEYNQKDNELESSKLKKSRKEEVDEEGNVIEEEETVNETNKSEKEEGEEDEENEKNNLDESFDISSSEEEEEDEDEENEKTQKDVNQSVDLLDSSLASKKFGIRTREDLELLSRSSRAAKIYHANEAELQHLRNAQEHDEAMELQTSTTQSNAGDQSMSKSSKQLTETSSKEMTRKKRIEQLEEENKKMQVLMANFSEEQLNRYEIYRRSAFQKSTVKKIIQTVCGKTVSASVVIAMSGIAKVFVGEIVETSLDVQEKWNESGPLQPKHIREAFRVFKNTNKLCESYKYKKHAMF